MENLPDLSRYNREELGQIASECFRLQKLLDTTMVEMDRADQNEYWAIWCEYRGSSGYTSHWAKGLFTTKEEAQRFLGRCSPSVGSWLYTVKKYGLAQDWDGDKLRAKNRLLTRAGSEFPYEFPYDFS